MEPALKTFLICSYPRSRSLWLSHFLSVPGLCLCEHEATEHSAGSQEFWERALRLARPRRYYGNADSANIFVLPALLAARPLTKVIWIDRPIAEVAKSMHRAGFPQLDCGQIRALTHARAEADNYVDAWLPFAHLSDRGCISWLWNYLFDEVPFQEERWLEFKDQNISYTAATMPHRETAKFEIFLRNETQYLNEPTGKDG